MEGQKIFEIPVTYFEEDLDSGLSKEKKKKILNLFKNHNKLNSGDEFDKISAQLHFACQQGDLDLIKILLSESITYNDMEFKIDTINKTASLIGVSQKIINIVIPRTINYKSTDYLVTSISKLGGTFKLYTNVKTVQFEEDSAVKTIYGHSLSNSNITDIYFPSNLTELKSGWCVEAKKLTNIIISPSNGQFIFEDKKYLLGKSNVKNSEFDTLLFAPRDISEICISPKITIIGEFAFFRCLNLTKVEIPKNSNLQIIGKNAFSSTKISEISIPISVTKICKYAFSNCSNLTKIRIPANSNLQTIEKGAFQSSKIEIIYIPNHLFDLQESWCNGAYKLKKIFISKLNGQFVFKEDKYLLGKSNSNNDEFDTILFATHDISEISIPSNVTKIQESVFYNCQNLTKVEIPPNSNLQIIGKGAFTSSSIKEIFIPSSVTKISKNSFTNCQYLKKVLIPKNSYLKSIGRNAFSFTLITSIFIPPSVTKISKLAFSNCTYLEKIVIPKNLLIIGENAFQACRSLMTLVIPKDSKLKIIGEGAFSYLKSIKYIFIPSNVEIINQELLTKNTNLEKVEFSSDSNLQIIEKHAFYSSGIRKICIPSSVFKICDNAFSNCGNLKEVRFNNDSNLKTIEKYAFAYSNIHQFSIPQNVSEINQTAFFSCSNLQIIEIQEETKLKSAPIFDYINCKNAILMIPASLKRIVSDFRV